MVAVIAHQIRRLLLGRLTHTPTHRPRPTDPRHNHPRGRHDRTPALETEPAASSGPDPAEGDEFTPSGIAVGARVVSTDDGLVAVLAITGYPAAVFPGWLSGLLAHPGMLDVSLHIGPIDPIIACDRLKRRRNRLAAGLNHDAAHGRVLDPAEEAADDGAADLATAIARSQARVYTTAIYLAVRAPDADTLADEVDAVRKLAASMLLDARPVSYRQLDGWRACLPVGLDRLGAHRVMDTDPLAASFPFASDELPGPDPVSSQAPAGVFYGFAPESNGLVFYDEFSAENFNTVVLGPSGSGKSYLTKATLLRSLYRRIHGHHVQAVVVDPEDEYTPLANTVGGVVVRVGAPGVRINPLDVPIHHRADGGRHAHRDALTLRSLFLFTFISVLLGVELDPTTRAVLDDACATTYARAGIDPDQPGTWERPAPILADLAAALADHPDPAAAGLATQLRPYVTGAWSRLFNGPTTIPATSLGAGARLVSWSLRELPDELRVPGTLLVLDHIGRQIDDPADRRPRVVVIDEAWLLMSQPVAAAWLKWLFKGDRKKWVAARFVSQDVDDVLASDLGRAVLNNSATTLLMRQEPQTIDEITRLYGLTAGEQSFLLRAQQGEALLITPARRVAVKIAASPVEDELITTNPAQRAALGGEDTTSYFELPPNHHTPTPTPTDGGTTAGGGSPS
jgi:type IV secretory system conjugative DNA transfer VirD4/TraG family protein/uncharacterized protein DUF87